MRHAAQQHWMPVPEREALRADTQEALERVIEQYGTLITPWIASAMAHVTNQRIYQLIEQGKFTKILVFGSVQIPKREFDAWKCSARTPGRPRIHKNPCLSPTIYKQVSLADSSHLVAELPALSKGCDHIG